jgi:ubiquitin-protein ligase
MSAALSTRREQDVAKIQALCAASGGKIRLSLVEGRPPQKLTLELTYPTAGGRGYPGEVQGVTRITIALGARYPFVEPSVQINTPILHPNVYSSGQVCLGRKWIATEGLDLLVKRLVQIVTFDPEVLNEASAANGAALSWYREQRRKTPSAFPTAKVAFGSQVKTSAISWTNTK